MSIFGLLMWPFYLRQFWLGLYFGVCSFRVDPAGALKMLDVKMTDVKLTDQMTGHENARHEIAGMKMQDVKLQDMK